MLRTWWLQRAKRRFQTSPRARSPGARGRAASQPQLERLEDRLAPASHTWTGIYFYNSLWSVPSNWLGNSPPSPSESNVDLIFPASARQRTNTNDISNLDIRSITFSGTNYSLSGNPIVLDYRITTTNNTGTNTIGLPVNLAGRYSRFFDVADGGQLSLSGDVTGGVDGNFPILEKSGPGILQLSGTNTYQGPTRIDAGTLQLGRDNAVPSTSGVTIQDVGALLALNNHDDTIRSLEGSGGVTLGSGTLTTGNNDASSTFFGSISGTGGLTKIGAGTFTLAGSSNYTGPTFVADGVVRMGSTNALNSTTAVQLGWRFSFTTPTLDLNNFGAVIGSLAGESFSRVTLGAVFLDTGLNNASTTFDGVISGPGGLYKEGTGTLTLAGANTYTGITIIATGTLRLGAANVIVGEVAVSSVGTFDLNNFNCTIANLGDAGSGGGRVTLGTGTLSTGGNNGSLHFRGVITGTGGLVKVGSGTFTLGGSNSYTGDTNVSQGTLQMGASSALPPGSAVLVAQGATLDLNNFNTTIGSLESGGTVRLGSGTLTTGGNNLATIFGGIITGSGGLTKTGFGGLVLNGNNTYTGTTAIMQGVVQVNGSQPGSNVTVSNGAELEGSGTVGTISTLGNVFPGTFSPGILTSGTAIFNAGSSFIVKLNGRNPSTGYDQLNALGSVNLAANPSLYVRLGFASALGDRFVILLSTGGSITGTFNGLPENATLIAGGARFQIHYTPNSVFLIHIAAPADHFLVSLPGSSTAGSPFDITVAALDPQNNIDTFYTGQVHFTTSDPTGGTLPFDYDFTPADKGVHIFAGRATLFTAGSQTITVTDNLTAIFGTGSTTITAAAADHFLVSAPASATSGTRFDITVTALDPYGNTDTNYQGTVTFTSSDTDPAVVLSAAYPFTSTDGGVHTFTDTGLGETTLITEGDQTITATDTSSGITGSATVTVTPGPLAPRGRARAPDDVLFDAAAFSAEYLPGPPTTAGNVVDPPANEELAPPPDARNLDQLFALTHVQISRDLGRPGRHRRHPTLLDGGGVTAPHWAIWFPNGRWEVENRGVGPDVEVEFDPKAVRAGRDPQLEKAVDVGGSDVAQPRQLTAA